MTNTHTHAVGETYAANATSDGSRTYKAVCTGCRYACTPKATPEAARAAVEAHIVKVTK